MTQLNSNTNQVIFVRSGDEIFLGSINPNEKNIYELAPGFYSVEFNQLSQRFFLRTMVMKGMPSRIYGDVKIRSERIINTFESRQKNTGVLLHGLKGTGKSLLSRQICIDAVERGIPVLNITQGFVGPAFNEFMEKIKQRVVVNVDEFEKVYSEKSDDGAGSAQEQLLSLLDGVSEQNKLWVLTVNNTQRVDEHMLNRPGRIFYKFEYGVIPEETVIEICEDKGMKKEHLDDLLSFYSMIEHLTYDVLGAIIEECNRYDELPRQVVKILNIDTQAPKNRDYDITVDIEGHRVVKLFHRISLENPCISFVPSEHEDVIRLLSHFNKSFADTDDVDAMSVWDIADHECKIEKVHGRRGVLELSVDLRETGFGKFAGIPAPKMKITAVPHKEQKFDYWSMF